MEANPVNHPPPELLHALASGKLDNAVAERVFAHLNDCPECRQAVVAVSGDAFLQRLRANRPAETTRSEAHAAGETAASLPTIPRAVPASSASPGTQEIPLELRNHPQYEVLRELGRGGMGVVFLARDRLMHRQAVLKLVNKEFLDRPGVKERFLREIRAAGQLSHRNIVTAYGALPLGELVAFAMEFVEGEDLARFVRSRGGLPLVNACYYTQQVAAGLQHACDKGLVHRDIKPQNLMLAREGKKHLVKILDFGLAKATSEGGQADSTLTGTGAMMGTPDYIAPEQAVDAAGADIRADIYSLGCTLYFLLAGRPPFKARSMFELLDAHRKATATPLDQVRLEVPGELAAVVAKMMAKEPGQRYQKPAELVQALTPFLKGEGKPLQPGVPVTIGILVGTGRKNAAKPGDSRNDPKPVVAATKIEGEATIAKAMPKVGGVAGCATGKPYSFGPKQSWKWLVLGLSLAALGGLWAGGVFRLTSMEGKGDDPAIWARTSSKHTDPPTGVATESKPDDPAKGSPNDGKASEYDLTGGYRFVHFGTDSQRVLLRFTDSEKQQYFARVYDLSSGKAVTPPLPHGGTVSCAYFSPDGKRVVTASDDKTARVWDAATGRPVTPPLKHDNNVWHACFSPDGKRVVTASHNENAARVWDAATGQIITNLTHYNEVHHACFSPDGKRVVTASDDKTARVWDAATGQVITTLKHGDWVRHACYSPDGKRVVTASGDKTARVWDAATGQAITTLKHDETVWHACFSPDGKRVVTASADSTAQVWDAATGQAISLPLKHDHKVSYACFSPDGKRVFTHSDGGWMGRVWDAATGQVITTLSNGNGDNACFSPDGKRVVTVVWWHPQTAALWDAMTGQTLMWVNISAD